MRRPKLREVYRPRERRSGPGARVDARIQHHTGKILKLKCGNASYDTDSASTTTATSGKELIPDAQSDSSYLSTNLGNQEAASGTQANQSSYQRTLTVLSRIKDGLYKNGLIKRDVESLKVMLLCGSDLLESFSIPGAWIRDQVRAICKDFGVICIRREGTNIEQIISNDEILQEYTGNVISVDEIIPNQISSTKVRECISRGLSVKYLTLDEVIDYIRNQKLYLK